MRRHDEPRGQAECSGSIHLPFLFAINLTRVLAVRAYPAGGSLRFRREGTRRLAHLGASACVSCCTAIARSPSKSSALMLRRPRLRTAHLARLARLPCAVPRAVFQSTRSRVLDTTYFLAASIVRRKGFHPLRHFSRPRRPKRCLHHLISHTAKNETAHHGGFVYCEPGARSP